MVHAKSTLVEPDWEVSLAAARRAQDRLEIWQAGSFDKSPLPSVERITVIAGLQPLAARALLGLSA
tara:strand:- start:22360 stop:22557 length:198 start_codon:yes stop_codon:yes gene_type:complete